MVKLRLLTPNQEARKKKYSAIYAEYTKLSQIEGQSRLEIIKYLQAKYTIKAPCTIYNIIRKERARLRYSDSVNNKEVITLPALYEHYTLN